VDDGIEQEEMESVGIMDYRTIQYDSIPWDDPIGDFTHTLDMSPETAIEIAKLVLSDTVSGPRELEDRIILLGKVDGRDIYVVTLGIEGMVGGCLSVAINSKTGEILKMWAGE